jgi:hypothetical protein
MIHGDEIKTFSDKVSIKDTSVHSRNYKQINYETQTY